MKALILTLVALVGATAFADVTFSVKGMFNKETVIGGITLYKVIDSKKNVFMIDQSTVQNFKRCIGKKGSYELAPSSPLSSNSSYIIVSAKCQN